MVLGMKTKVRKNTSVQLTYLIHIQEIKPWPPSHSLRSLRSVQIQWEHGEKHTGSTNSVIPSLGSGANDGKIEFNESFRLPVTLMRNMSVRAGDADLFHKNCLEFSMYEPRRDKTLKGQLLGTATVDLAEYGVIRQCITINVPVKCQRIYKNTAQPLLYFKIQPTGKSCNNISSQITLSKEESLDRNGGESVLALMKEEYAEEADSNTYSDDDVSSNSSVTISSDSSGGLPPKHEQESNSVRDKGKSDERKSFTSDTGIKECDTTSIIASREDNVANSLRSSSMDLSYDLEGPDNGRVSSISPGPCSISIHKAVVHCGHSSLSCFTNGQREEETNGSISNEQNRSSANCANMVDRDQDGRVAVLDEGCLDEIGKTIDVERNDEENISENTEMQHQYVGSGAIDPVSTVSIDDQGSQAIDLSPSSRVNLGAKEFTPSERLRHVRSVRSTSEYVKCNGAVINPLTDEVKGSGFLGDSKNESNLIKSNERKDAKASARDTRTTLLEAKARQMELKIQILEGELREVAAVEVALYSIVAEHGSSISKVHAPARRLSRFYLHAGQEHSLLRRASAARSAISGLVLVSKACGNDVPRLTYWLSNSVVLRAIISKAMADKELSTPPAAHSVAKQNDKTPALKWESSLVKNKSECNRASNWEDPQTLISALEKVESWIFSRTVESIWWQNLTPHMQHAGASRANTKATHSQGQLDLWKQAFKEACERLCPVRAGGHECGCLSMLPRLIMEQCVSRLDIAMFNAILRESADDIPTDPVSDPISDAKVLPILPGKSSFGDGAQLKNAIGNWSRWLTDLFGMDVDSAEDKNESHSDDDDDDRQDSSFKSFHLLNALSDLMMLPKDMLLSKTIRQEVCPTFGVSLIKRVLNTFVPDEFCPDPIPGVVFEALDSEDPMEDSSGVVTSYPYNASPPLYIPPSPNAVATIIGDCEPLQRSRSSLLRKSNTSDDELDELNSPLALIFTDPSETHQSALRFDLLRDIWLNSD